MQLAQTIRRWNNRYDIWVKPHEPLLCSTVVVVSLVNVVRVCECVVGPTYIEPVIEACEKYGQYPTLLIQPSL